MENGKHADSDVIESGDAVVHVLGQRQVFSIQINTVFMRSPACKMRGTFVPAVAFRIRTQPINGGVNRPITVDIWLRRQSASLVELALVNLYAQDTEDQEHKHEEKQYVYELPKTLNEGHHLALQT